MGFWKKKSASCFKMTWVNLVPLYIYGPIFPPPRSFESCRTEYAYVDVRLTPCICNLLTFGSRGDLFFFGFTFSKV